MYEYRFLDHRFRTFLSVRVRAVRTTSGDVVGYGETGPGQTDGKKVKSDLINRQEQNVHEFEQDHLTVLRLCLAVLTHPYPASVGRLVMLNSSVFFVLSPSLSIPKRVIHIPTLQ